STIGMDISYSDPFKTPLNGLKRFATSTPKVSLPIGGSNAKKINDLTTSRMSHSSTIPSLCSFSMEIDDDEIIDVTPAPNKDKSRGIPPQPPLPTNSKGGKRTQIDSDPILSHGTSTKSFPKHPLSRRTCSRFRWLIDCP
ncbi:hypothetical protein PFISCL1PPCAC_2540, partial [Pristionchus fissidentatus]